MGDKDTGEEKETTQTENGADSQDESQNDGGTGEKDGESNTSENDSANDNGDEAENTETESGKTEDEKSEEKPAPADEEPKPRKRNIDFILERKNQKIEKLENKGNGAKDVDSSEDKSKDIDAIVEEKLNERFAPLVQKQAQEQDKAEIASFVKANPDFAKYSAKVEKFAQHENRKNVPIEALFYEVAGPDLMAIGAERARKADEEAKESGAGGGTGKGTETEKSVLDLTDEEFSAKQEELRRKPRE